MRKSNRKFSIVYPEEKEGKIKDANRKLRAQVKNLQKKIKQLKLDNKTIERAYGKSCDFIQDKLSDKSLNDILEMVRGYDYKETEKGREREKGKDSKGFEDFVSSSCPRCDTIKGEGFAHLNLGKFKIESCACGYRRKAETSEGIKRS